MKKSKKKTAKEIAERKAKDIARIKAWQKKHAHTPEYKARAAAQHKARMDQLKADAQLGRIAREWMNRFAELMSAFAIASKIINEESSKKGTK